MLEFESAWGGWMEPWVANAPSRFKPKPLAFPTLAAAVGFAERHGLDYRIERPARRSPTSIRRRHLPRSWRALLSGNGRNGDIYHG
jgi:hypothetical protein